MPLNILQQAAQQVGILLYGMDQSQTPAMTQPGPWGAATTGYCAGLAMRWIALRYAGYDYRYDRNTKIAANPDWQATRDQNIYENVFFAPGGRTFPDDYKPAFGQYGLKLNMGRVTRATTRMTGVMLRRAGEAGIGCYFIVITGKGGGHGVAMQNMGNAGWRFFDANFGSFHLSDAPAFEAFIDWFMVRSGYMRNGFLSTDCRIVGIDPPPFTGANFKVAMEALVKSLGL